MRLQFFSQIHPPLLPIPVSAFSVFYTACLSWHHEVNSFIVHFSVFIYHLKHVDEEEKYYSRLHSLFTVGEIISSKHVLNWSKWTSWPTVILFCEDFFSPSSCMGLALGSVFLSFYILFLWLLAFLYVLWRIWVYVLCLVCVFEYPCIFVCFFCLFVNLFCLWVILLLLKLFFYPFVMEYICVLL